MNNVTEISKHPNFVNAHLEETIVGILLRNPEKLLTIPLESRWFNHLRPAIDAMHRMAGEGIEIDAVSLADELPAIAWQTVVNWQRNEFGATANYAHYVDQLKQEFTNRGVRASIEGALGDIDQGVPIADVVGGMMSRITEISTQDGANYTHDTKSALRLFVDQLEKTFDAKDKGGLGIKLGISDVDDMLGGMHPSDMVIVGARPGQGKTALALTSIVNIARQGKRIGFFSTEMSVVQVMGRMTSMVARIDAKKIRDANMDENEYKRMTAATVHIQDLPVMICDKPAITVSEIVLQARAWAMTGGLDFVVVDYLTRVRPDKVTQNRHLDVGEIATGLKNLARTLNIPVMVLAQLNRQVTQRAGKRPMVSDLRDSGIIEQEADQVLLLYRPSDDDDTLDKDRAEIIIDKNRHGECGMVACRFVPHLMKWISYDEEY